MERFERLGLLIGERGIRTLRDSTVAVFGLGGVGSYTVEALARSGVGGFILVDHDRVELSNINRQLYALEDTLGRLKVDVARERILKINPQARVVRKARFLTEDNVRELIGGPCDYIVDAIDTVASKVALITSALELGIGVVSAMGAGNRLDPTGFVVADIGETHTCPLARAVRRALVRRGIVSGVKTVFCARPPVGSHDPPGSAAFVTGVMGLMLAGVVVRDLLAKCGVADGAL